MLTSKQQELLLFIRDRLGRDGISPSFDEMREALQLKSKSGVHRLISALEERGFIRRLRRRAISDFDEINLIEHPTIIRYIPEAGE